MKDWIFKGYRSIEGASNVTDNTGQIPKVAKRHNFFQDTQTGKIWPTTDLAYKMKKRSRSLENFRRVYQKRFASKQVSIFAIVVKDKYSSISGFISDFKKKLSRKNIEVLGYVWTRDVGDIKFEKHVHLFIALNRITGEEFRGLFKNKNSQSYEVEFCNNVNGFKQYLKKKELYGIGKQRSFGKSKAFKLPNANLKRINAD